MKGNRAINRYAGAILGLAQEMGKLEEVKRDMDLIIAVAQESRDFRNFVQSPIVNADQKSKTIHALFDNRLSELSVKFIDLLVNRSRESLIIEIAETFVDRYKVLNRIATAVVTTASPLDDETRKSLIKQAENLSREADHIDLIEKVDPEIIGGFIFEMNNRKYNASVLGNLNRLRKEFEANPYIKEF
jgi:F-type H+-transporting ATPase subunit delta